MTAVASGLRNLVQGKGSSEVEGRQRPEPESRYGCFLSDLTGLARSPSAPTFHAPYISKQGPHGKSIGGNSSLLGMH